MTFIAGQANRVLKKVSGNIKNNLFGKTTTSPTEKIDRQKGDMTGIKGSELFSHLAFPLDVLSDESSGNHGHYIMFYVNEQTHSKIKFTDSVSGEENLSAAATGYHLGNELKIAQEKAEGDALNWVGEKTNPVSTHVLAGHNNKEQSMEERSKPFHAIANPPQTDYFKGKQFFVKRHATTRATTAITMYMPAQVQSTYNATYTDTQIGVFTSQAMQAFDALMKGGWDTFANIVGSADKELIDTIKSTAAATIGTIPGLRGMREVEQMTAGRIFAERMELAFKGVPKRQFQYAFKMMPRNKKESEEIQKIVKAFKLNMLPEFMESGGPRAMIVPNTFDIKYMYINSENEYLHTIGECVLESMNVTYGGDRYKTFEGELGKGAPPLETTLTLNFKEFDFLTRRRVSEDNA